MTEDDAVAMLVSAGKLISVLASVDSNGSGKAARARAEGVGDRKGGSDEKA